MFVLADKTGIHALFKQSSVKRFKTPAMVFFYCSHCVKHEL